MNSLRGNGGTAKRRTAAIAVVGSREDGDNVLVVRPVVALHHKLVRPRHEVQAIGRIELLGDVLAEGVAGASGRDAPATAVIWI